MTHRDKSITVVERRRRQSRKRALWIGKLTTPTGTYGCRVLNLSPSGAKIQLAAYVNVHDSVTLNLEPIGTLIGSVKWKRNFCIGVAFSERRFPTKRSRTFLPRELRLP